jgi:hypothetical protein
MRLLSRRAKKGVSEQVAAVQAAYREATVEVWATDEQRVGLTPILRTVWARKGQRPIARVQQRFKWLDVLAFVHPVSGQTAWQFASTVSTDVMSVALQTFAQAVGAGLTKHIVVVLDRAGYHTSPLLQVPDGLHLVFLPPSSPELQPAEHLWHYTDQPLINQHFVTIDDLEEALAAHCDRLQHQPDVIRSAASFHWWPAA